MVEVMKDPKELDHEPGLILPSALVLALFPQIDVENKSLETVVVLLLHPRREEGASSACCGEPSLRLCVHTAVSPC